MKTKHNYVLYSLFVIFIFIIINKIFYRERFQAIPKHRGTNYNTYDYQNYFSNKSPIFNKYSKDSIISDEINIYNGYTNHNYNQVDYIPISKKNVIQTVPAIDHYSCQYICDFMPDCDGINYALNECTLYKYLRNPLIHDKYLYC